MALMQKALYWINVLLGLWIATSPFALNFRTVEPAFYNNIVAGLLVAVVAFAGWVAEERSAKWHDSHDEHTGYSGGTASRAA